MKTNGELDALDRAIIRLRAEGKTKIEMHAALRELGMDMSERSVGKRISNLITVGHVERKGNGTRNGSHDWSAIGPAILRMVQVENRTIADASKAFGISYDTVRSWLARNGIVPNAPAAVARYAPEPGRTLASRGPLPAGHPTALACIGLDPAKFEALRS